MIETTPIPALELALEGKRDFVIATSPFGAKKTEPPSAAPRGKEARNPNAIFDALDKGFAALAKQHEREARRKPNGAAPS